MAAWFSPGPRCAPFGVVFVNTGNRPEPHRRRLVHDRRRVADVVVVPEAIGRAKVLDHVYVGRKEFPILGKTELYPALEPGASHPVVVLFHAGNPQQAWPATHFLRHERGKGHERVGRSLPPETAAAELRHQNEFGQFNSNHSCETGLGEGRGLG